MTSPISQSQLTSLAVRDTGTEPSASASERASMAGHDVASTNGKNLKLPSLCRSLYTGGVAITMALLSRIPSVTANVTNTTTFNQTATMAGSVINQTTTMAGSVINQTTAMAGSVFNQTTAMAGSLMGQTLDYVQNTSETAADSESHLGAAIGGVIAGVVVLGIGIRYYIKHDREAKYLMSPEGMAKREAAEEAERKQLQEEKNQAPSDTEAPDIEMSGTKTSEARKSTVAEKPEEMSLLDSVKQALPSDALKEIKSQE